MVVDGGVSGVVVVAVAVVAGVVRGLVWVMAVDVDDGGMVVVLEKLAPVPRLGLIGADKPPATVAVVVVAAVVVSWLATPMMPLTSRSINKSCNNSNASSQRCSSLHALKARRYALSSAGWYSIVSLRHREQG